jgi:hypothetical protein
MIRLLLFCVALSFICLDAYGQKSLLFNKNWRKQALYKTGDVISFRVEADPRKITDRIMGFEDSLIVFRNYKVNPKEITHMYVDKQTRTWYFLKYKYEKLFLFTGIGYLLVDGLNSREFSKETIIISGSLIGAGLLARWLISKKIKIKGRRKLVIMR